VVAATVLNRSYGLDRLSRFIENRRFSGVSQIRAAPKGLKRRAFLKNGQQMPGAFMGLCPFGNMNCGRLRQSLSTCKMSIA
jgi:hypothetical protein